MSVVHLDGPSKLFFFYALAASADELHRNANLSASAHAFMPLCQPIFHFNEQEMEKKKANFSSFSLALSLSTLMSGILFSHAPDCSHASACLANLDPISDCPNLQDGLCWKSRRLFAVFFFFPPDGALTSCSARALLSSSFRRWCPPTPQHHITVGKNQMCQCARFDCSVIICLFFVFFMFFSFFLFLALSQRLQSGDFSDITNWPTPGELAKEVRHERTFDV